MYSFALRTIAWYSSGAILDLAATSSGPASAPPAAACPSGRSSASTTADRRSCARSSAVCADTAGSGRTGVTTVIVSFTASNTTTSVGRISTASGIPIGSGWDAGSSSISRTMS
jgi:hypothetical protein